MRFASLVAIAALFAASAAYANIGRVKLVSGPAIIERGRAVIPATPGLILLKGDTIVTGKGGRMGVTFNDNTRFAIGPIARVNIAEYVFDDTTYKGKMLTKVDRGSLGIVSGRIAKSNRDAMRVKTPTALLGVRGTRFLVDVK
jgi:hypothetical protein